MRNLKTVWNKSSSQEIVGLGLNVLGMYGGSWEGWFCVVCLYGVNGNYRQACGIMS